MTQSNENGFKITLDAFQNGIYAETANSDQHGQSTPWATATIVRVTNL